MKEFNYANCLEVMKKMLARQTSEEIYRFGQMYVDPMTGGVDMTSLAEDCAEFFGQKDEGGPLDEQNHWIWDASVEAAEWYEQGRKT